MVLALFFTWRALLVNNPYMMARLFGQVLILVTSLLRRYSKFIGVIMFLVYIGGIMILLRYCVMILPTNKFWRLSITIGVFLLTLLAYLLTIDYTPRVFAYGLLYRARAILLVALLLYLVILSVVSIIDYSCGIIKVYVEHAFLYDRFATILVCITLETNSKL